MNDGNGSNSFAKSHSWPYFANCNEAAKGVHYTEDIYYSSTY